MSHIFCSSSLKNHTDQMRPSYHPERLFSQSEILAKKETGPKPITQLWHMIGRCHDGTILIRRTRKDDVLREGSIQSFGKKRLESIPRPISAAPEPDLISQNGHQHICSLKCFIRFWE